MHAVTRNTSKSAGRRIATSAQTVCWPGADLSANGGTSCSARSHRLHWHNGCMLQRVAGMQCQYEGLRPMFGSQIRFPDSVNFCKDVAADKLRSVGSQVAARVRTRQ